MLIVDDDLTHCEMLRYNFEHHDFKVMLAGTAEDTLIACKVSRPDMVILDWTLPDAPGLYVCRHLREDPATHALPIIMVTARGAERDRILGLESGADDYLVKPISPNELIARTRAVLRRAQPALQAEQLTVGPLVMSLTGHTVACAGKQTHLGPKEFQLLHIFMQEPGRVFDRDELRARLWSNSVEIHPRTVDVHVRRLRLALLKQGATDVIQTVRPLGYRLSIAHGEPGAV